MSIVEKAINRQIERNKPRSPDAQTDAHSSPSESVRESGSASIVVPIQDIAEADPSSILNDPSLRQDFKFLKRPLLSQLFKPSKHAKAGHVVLVTSDLPGAGKSFVSLNLAFSIAQEQLTDVVLIDADPLRRNLTTALGLEDEPGLLEALADLDSRPSDFVLPSDVPSLHFLPAGQAREDSTELLAGQRFGKVVSALDDPDTVIILDSPPLLLTAEARVLVEQSNYTLVVVEAGRTSAADMAAVFKIIGDTVSKVSLVLNKAPSSNHGHEAGYYGYGYGYGYGKKR